jgi:uncharacterized protein YdhG (YjbR/CyaY superfamily)
MYPAYIQKIPEQIRQTIKQAASTATETISYGMPAFRQDKVLVHYAVHKEHIGFCPTPNPIFISSKNLKSKAPQKGQFSFLFTNLYL